MFYIINVVWFYYGTEITAYVCMAKKKIAAHIPGLKSWDSSNV